MKSFISLATFAILLAGANTTLAQTTGAVGTNGSIVEQHIYELPTWEMLVDEMKTTYSKETVEKIRKSSGLELLQIRYMSDGLKIVGFIY